VNNPAGISVSEYAGVLAVSNDSDGGNMLAWAGEGVSWTYQSKFSGAPSGAAGSHSLTWDGLSIYLCDYANSSGVSVYTRPNLASTSWTPGPGFGGSGPGLPDSPIGSALAASELEFYVSDSNNSRVSIWTRPSLSSQTWTYATSFGSAGSGSGQFSIPAGMAIAPNGLTLWVADSGNKRVQVWTRASLSTVNWSYLTSFGTNGSGDGQLNGPMAVAVSNGGGYVYVADTGNNRFPAHPQRSRSRPGTGPLPYPGIVYGHRGR